MCGPNERAGRFICERGPFHVCGNANFLCAKQIMQKRLMMLADMRTHTHTHTHNLILFYTYINALNTHTHANINKS